MNDVEITFNPTKADFDKIQKWLESEWIELERGVYGSFASIINSYETNGIAVLLYNGSPISFITWSYEGKIAHILNAQTQIEYGGNGCMEMLLEALIQELTTQNCIVVKLRSSTPMATRAWIKYNFERYPNVPAFNAYNDLDCPHLYRIIVPTKQECATHDGNAIKLFADEPNSIDEKTLTWQWPIDYQLRQLILTEKIVFPAHKDWKLQLIMKDDILEDNTAGAFVIKGVSAFYDGFLIVDIQPSL